MVFAHGIGGSQDLPISLPFALAGGAAALAVSFIVLAAGVAHARGSTRPPTGRPLPAPARRGPGRRGAALLLRAARAALHRLRHAGPRWPGPTTWPTRRSASSTCCCGSASCPPRCCSARSTGRSTRSARCTCSSRGSPGATRARGCCGCRPGSGCGRPASGCWRSSGWSWSPPTRRSCGRSGCGSPATSRSSSSAPRSSVTGGSRRPTRSRSTRRSSATSRSSAGRPTAPSSCAAPCRTSTASPRSPGCSPSVAVLLGSTAFDSFQDSLAWVRFTQDSAARRGAARHRWRCVAFCVVVGGALRRGHHGGPGGRRGGRRHLPRLFAHSLVPIVVGYMVAHYLSYFVEVGQQTLIYLSDPMVDGSNYLGTADLQVNYWLSLHPTFLATTKVRRDRRRPRPRGRRRPRPGDAAAARCATSSPGSCRCCWSWCCTRSAGSTCCSPSAPDRAAGRAAAPPRPLDRAAVGAEQQLGDVGHRATQRAVPALDEGRARRPGPGRRRPGRRAGTGPPSPGATRPTRSRDLALGPDRALGASG